MPIAPKDTGQVPKSNANPNFQVKSTSRVEPKAGERGDLAIQSRSALLAVSLFWGWLTYVIMAIVAWHRLLLTRLLGVLVL